jgi:hypothetical protein
VHLTDTVEHFVGTFALIVKVYKPRQCIQRVSVEMLATAL